jgi:uncharacterized membrane protein
MQVQIWKNQLDPRRLRLSEKVPQWLWLLVGVSTFILFLCSSARHALFHSTAMDLGYFDQATYLISQGLPPIVSFWGYHFLGGHADWILYLVAGLYKIYPDVHWLFAVQAVSLAGGTFPSFALARQAGLTESQAKAIALAYLLYPLIFNLNLFDFHPEVIALPLMLTAIWTARENRTGWFALCIVLILGCRDALSLTVAAMGIWLFLFEKKKKCGAIAFTLGLSWFLIATQVLIPQFRPSGVESVARYAHLGNSLSEVALNLFLKPGLVLGSVFSAESLFYLFLLFLPIGWCFSGRHLTLLFPTIPTLTINILSNSSSQRDLLHQYSLPVLPFLILLAIATLKSETAWIRKPRWIMLWSLIAFLALAKYGFFTEKYLSRLESWQAMQVAIAQIKPTQDPVLTTSYLLPHLTHRPVLEYTRATEPPRSLEPYKYVLLNRQDPGIASTPELVQQIFEQIQQNQNFRIRFERDRIFLFERKS